MLFKIYSIYDSKSHQFQFPFFQKNDEVAIRQFALAMKKVPFYEDLDLYCLGEFDDDIKETDMPNNTQSLNAFKVSRFVTSGSSVTGYFDKEVKNEN